MKINKDTKLYGSFSNNPGNNGCIFFNEAFERYGINAIYKSFYSDDAETLIKSVRHLDFAGFAVSMPLKIEIFKYLDYMSPDAMKIGAVNTVVNTNGALEGYNTDWIGIRDFMSDACSEGLTILGDGGFSKAVQYWCTTKNVPFTVITRENWGDVWDLEGYVFNATPIDISTKGCLIDGRTSANAGKAISNFQARAQFKLYTGFDYEAP